MKNYISEDITIIWAKLSYILLIIQVQIIIVQRKHITISSSTAHILIVEHQQELQLHQGDGGEANRHINETGKNSKNWSISRQKDKNQPSIIDYTCKSGT